MTIKVYTSGFVHYNPICDECGSDFLYPGVSDRKSHQKIRNAVRAHVNKTGHRVVLCAGKETSYTKTVIPKPITFEEHMKRRKL